MNVPDPSPSPTPQIMTTLTDSPWFWPLVIAAFLLIVLLGWVQWRDD